MSRKETCHMSIILETSSVRSGCGFSMQVMLVVYVDSGVHYSPNKAIIPGMDENTP